MPPPAFKADEFRIHPDHDAAYRALEDAAKRGLKPQRAIWKRFQAARKMLGQDPLWGDVIRASAIPAYFHEQYGVQNLYCIDLKSDVRCFYTIDERTILFLDIVDHDQYDKWFPPKGRKASGDGDQITSRSTRPLAPLTAAEFGRYTDPIVTGR